jgi:hypothetical protein
VGGMRVGFGLISVTWIHGWSDCATPDRSFNFSLSNASSDGATSAGA